MKNMLLCLILALAGSVWASAQDAPSGSKGKAHARTITGCLSQSDGKDEFLLTGKNGSTWEVRSDAVSLAEHVGFS